MNIAIPRWLTVWLVGAGLIGVILTLVVAIRAYVKVRRAGYYIVREAARRTAVRASLLVVILTLLTIIVPFIPTQDPAPKPTLAPTPHSSLTPTPTRAIPTATATSTPTPLPTATEPFIPTSTPQPTLPITFTTSFSQAVPPPADASIEFWTLAQGVSDDNRPVEAATQFTVGIERIYLFYTYDGLLPGVPITIVWYHEGELLSGGTDLWEAQQSGGERYVFLTPSGGYTIGAYEVQVWLGNRMQVRVFFSVVGD